ADGRRFEEERAALAHLEEAALLELRERRADPSPPVERFLRVPGVEFDAEVAERVLDAAELRPAGDAVEHPGDAEARDGVLVLGLELALRVLLQPGRELLHVATAVASLGRGLAFGGRDGGEGEQAHLVA